MPKTITKTETKYTYLCEHCGNVYPSYAAANKCENSHSKKEIKAFEKRKLENQKAADDRWNFEYNRGRDCS